MPQDEEADAACDVEDSPHKHSGLKTKVAGCEPGQRGVSKIALQNAKPLRSREGLSSAVFDQKEVWLLSLEMFVDPMDNVVNS